MTAAIRESEGTGKPPSTTRRARPRPCCWSPTPRRNPSRWSPRDPSEGGLTAVNLKVAENSSMPSAYRQAGQYHDPARQCCDIAAMVATAMQVVKKS